jgi:hypothetical protein
MSLLRGGSETSAQQMALFSVEIVCGIVVVVWEGVRYEYTVNFDVCLSVHRRYTWRRKPTRCYSMFY